MRLRSLGWEDGAKRPLVALTEGHGLQSRALDVIALIVVGDRGEGAVVYGAQDAASPNPLVVCDFEVAPVGATTFADIAARLDALKAQCRTSASAIFCDESLLLFARATGNDAHPIPKDFRAEDRLLSVAGHVSAANVRITATVVEKAKSSPFAGALNLRAGENVDDPLWSGFVSMTKGWLLHELRNTDYHFIFRTER